jgi:hypothetical protein
MRNKLSHPAFLIAAAASLCCACSTSAPPDAGMAGGAGAGAGVGGSLTAGVGSISADGGSGAGQGPTGTAGSSSGGAGGSFAGAGSGGGSGTAGAGGQGPGGGAGATGGVASATGCSGKKYKLCEDFETGTVGQLPAGWTQKNGFGPASPRNAALAADAFHSGTMALKADDLGLKGAARAMKSLASLGATASKHWGRIFYRAQVPEPKPTGGVIHTTWVTLLAAEGDNHVVDTVEGTNGSHQWLYNRTDSCATGSAYNWKYDSAWHCVEWYVDGPAATYRFFSDSTEVTSIGFTGKTCTTVANGYTAVVVGSTTYQTPLPGARVLWFDDLAIDDSRIGCD